MLVIYAVRAEKIYLLISILYKTLVDGMLPFLAYFISFTEIGIFFMELPIIVIAALGFLGTRWVGSRFAIKKPVRVKAKRKKVISKKRR